MANQKELGNINGSMDSITKGNGLADSDTVLGCGKEQREIAMSDNGSLEKQMAMEFMFGLMEIVTKVNFLNVLSMVRELSVIRVETYTKDSSLKESLMAMVNITGRMEAISKAFSKWVGVKDRVFGKNHQEIVINMKDNTSKIRKMVMESFHGTMAISIKEPTRMMKGTAMVRCIGSMAATIKVNGRLESKMDKVIFI